VLTSQSEKQAPVRVTFFMMNTPFWPVTGGHGAIPAVRGKADQRVTVDIIMMFASHAHFFAGFGVLHHLQGNGRLVTIAGELT
jgi:hypothetical protein